MRFLGIDFAPLHLAAERRFQTASVFYWVSTFLFLGFGSLAFFIYLLFTRFYWLAIAYGIWLWFDKDISSHGGRRSHWVRRWTIWRYFRDYFPVQLIKTTELDPNRNYVLGFHPHGIFVAGAFLNFCTEATDFSEKFPGITPSLLTLEGQFWFPFYRDYVLSSGACSASPKSFEHLLTKQGKGNAVVVVVGGAAEALDAHPNKPYVLTLKKRKGFVKLALRHGASLVPVFSFGENDLFSQAPNPEGSILRSFQNMFKKYMGFVPVLFLGRGIFQYNFGYVPYRRPIYTVVGKPIDLPHIPNATNEEIEKYHSEYVESLKKLVDDHKVKFKEYKDLTIEI